MNVLIILVIRETDGSLPNGRMAVWRSSKQILTKCRCLQLETQCLLDGVLYPLMSELAPRGQASTF